jgi:D-3-phosphoglycerate dehydrogenase
MKFKLFHDMGKEKSTMAFKVINAIHIPGIDYGEHLLESLAVKIENGMWLTEDDIIKNVGDADALICSGPVQPITMRVLGNLPKCRIVASLAIGYDKIDLKTATDLCIVVTNSPDYCLDEVSDQAIALMMALGRKLFQMDHAVRSEQKHIVPPNRKVIEQVAYPIFRMCDQTLGIIGFGKIGTATALKARGKGMRVIAYDPYVFGAVMKTHGVEPVDLDTLLKESDFISIHALLNEETRGMIGSPEFKKMKPTSYLINTARGGIVDENALVTALNESIISGAGLDATENEPLKKVDPLLQTPNVILTGHSGWYSTTSDIEMWQKAMSQVFMALKGEWPLYAVNPDVKTQWIEKWGG